MAQVVVTLMGDVIVVSVKSVIPSSDVKKGAVSKALIVRTKKDPSSRWLLYTF